MLAVRCASCGAPTPITLGSDHAVCDTCGARSPFDAATTERVRAANASLRALDVRQRQLESSETRALRVADASMGCFVVVLVVLGLVAGALTFTLVQAFATSATHAHPSDVAWLLGPAFGTLLLFVVPSVLYLRRLRASRAALETACAAVPPARPGEPARCHLCGAGLAAAGSDAVARCAYCAADNLVAPAVLARSAARARMVLDDFESEVRVHGASTRDAAVRGVFWLPVFAVVLLVGACVAWGAAVMASASVESSVDETAELGWLATSSGRCVAMRESIEQPRARPAWAIERTRAVGQPYERLDPRALIGRTFMTADETFGASRPVVVEAVYSSPFFAATVYARVREADGSTERMSLTSGLCERTALPP